MKSVQILVKHFQFLYRLHHPAATRKWRQNPFRMIFATPLTCHLPVVQIPLWLVPAASGPGPSHTLATNTLNIGEITSLYRCSYNRVSRKEILLQHCSEIPIFHLTRVKVKNASVPTVRTIPMAHLLQVVQKSACICVMCQVATDPTARHRT